jgi:hypothetical protein
MPPPTTEPPVITPQVPVVLDLWLDREVLLVGATATLTVTVYNQHYEQAPALTVSLTLPAGLVTTDGQTGTLPLAVPLLAAGEVYQQVLPVQADAAKLAASSAALLIAASVSAEGYDGIETDVLLGVAPATDQRTVVLGEQGAVLQDSERGITLVIPPGAAPLGTTFAYTSLFQAPPATPALDPTLSERL